MRSQETISPNTRSHWQAEIISVLGFLGGAGVICAHSREIIADPVLFFAAGSAELIFLGTLVYCIAKDG